MPSTIQTFHVCPSILWSSDPVGHVCRLNILIQKAEAVTAIGRRSLSLPAWIKTALAANDRLRFFLSAVQVTAAHAACPGLQTLDLVPEIGVAQSDAAWLHDTSATVIQIDSALRLPNLQRLAKWVVEELGVMVHPVLEVCDDVFCERMQNQSARLGKIDVGESTNTQLRALTSGMTAGGENSLRQLIMDLYGRLIELERSLATEEIDGTHIWQVFPEDCARIVALMYRLDRTTLLKFDHTDLGTTMARDGDKLLLQSDIGATDVHVLVAQA